MYNMKTRTAAIILAIISTACVAMALSSASTSPCNESITNNDNFSSEEINPSIALSPEVPDSVIFAGEKIALTTQDRRERMDREMLAFTYSHINTLLQIKRANRLFPIIEPILKECGVHDDLKYLMIIESNGDTEAISTAKAGGLWQFIESTGKSYGLQVNKEVDERFHIEKATRAACEYLKESYHIYRDWLTVAASYNTGRGNVAKRMESQKEKKAINLKLLPETSRYIFRLLAVKIIFSNPQKYGFCLRSRDLYPYIPHKEIVEVDSAVESWGVFAKKHNITYLQLREANPWIRGTSLTNKEMKKYEVKIPDRKALEYDPEKTKAHDRRWVVE